MARKPAKKRLADTLKGLMETRPDLSSGPKLAVVSGVSQKTINNIQRGRCDTRISTIEKLAAVFRVDPLIFFAPSDGNLLTLIQAYELTDERGRDGLSLAAKIAMEGRNGGVGRIGKVDDG